MQVFIYYINYAVLKSFLFIIEWLRSNGNLETNVNTLLQSYRVRFLRTNNPVKIFFWEKLFRILLTTNIEFNNNVKQQTYTPEYKTLLLQTTKNPLYFYVNHLLNHDEIHSSSTTYSIKLLKSFVKILKNKTSFQKHVSFLCKNSWVVSILIHSFLLNQFKNYAYLTSNYVYLTLYDNMNIVHKNNTATKLNSTLVTNGNYYIYNLVYLLFNTDKTVKITKITTTHTPSTSVNTNSTFFQVYKTTALFFYKTASILSKKLVKYSENWRNAVTKIYTIRLPNVFLNKHLSTDLTNNQKILFLRKNKIFNKGRYSRNRQLYRTGVYWCIWVSIFLGVGIYFVFYRFTLNFGFHWWLTFIGLNSFFFAKLLKYRLYNLINVVTIIKASLNASKLVLFNIYTITIKYVTLVRTILFSN